MRKFEVIDRSRNVSRNWSGVWTEEQLYDLRREADFPLEYIMEALKVTPREAVQTIRWHVREKPNPRWVWNSPTPEPMYDGDRCIGFLQPITPPELLHLGIQSWSRPKSGVQS